MPIKIYVCNLWPSLQIGRDVRFVGGKFATDDPGLQHLIETNNAFGVNIHFKDTEAEMAREGQRLREEKTAERARRREAILRQIQEEEAEEEKRRQLAEEAQARELEREQRDEKLSNADAIACAPKADEAGGEQPELVIQVESAPSPFDNYSFGEIAAKRVGRPRGRPKAAQVEAQAEKETAIE